MKQQGKFTLVIDPFSPSTIPMARLAEYMGSMAALLGERTSVHFSELITGSTAVVSLVDYEAIPKVTENIAQAPLAPKKDPRRKAISRIDALLRDDNGSGYLNGHSGAKILDFPGATSPRPRRIGPIKRHTQIDGLLVRLEGKDETAHAGLVDASGSTYSASMTRHFAKEIAHYLFSDTPIRLTGEGSWVRDPENGWKLDSMLATAVQALDNVALLDAIAQIRQVAAPAIPHLSTLNDLIERERA